MDGNECKTKENIHDNKRKQKITRELKEINYNTYMNHLRAIYAISPAPTITCERKSISISCKIRHLKISNNQIQRLFLQKKEAMIEMK